MESRGAVGEGVELKVEGGDSGGGGGRWEVRRVGEGGDRSVKMS